MRSISGRNAGLVVLSLMLLSQLALMARRARLHVTLGDPVPIDFREYYVAAKMAMGEGNGALYPVANGRVPSVGELAFAGSASGEWQRLGAKYGLGAYRPLNCPPTFAILVAPLSFLSPPKAALAWKILSYFAIIFSAWLIVALESRGPRGLLVFLLALAFIVSEPFKETLLVGQVNAFVLLAWAAGAFFFTRGKIGVSASCFALGTLIKVTPGLAVLVAIMQRQWRWLAYYSIGMAGLLGFSIYKLGWENQFAYFFIVLRELSRGVPGVLSQSLVSFLLNLQLGYVYDDRWLTLPPAIPTSVTIIVKFVVIIVVAVVCWAASTRKVQPTDAGPLWGAFAALSLLISPIAWRHHFVVALFPIAVLWLRLLAPNADRGKAYTLVLSLSTLVLLTPYVQYFEYKLLPIVALVLSGVPVLATATLIIFCLLESSQPKPTIAFEGVPEIVQEFHHEQSE